MKKNSKKKKFIAAVIACVLVICMTGATGCGPLSCLSCLSVINQIKNNSEESSGAETGQNETTQSETSQSETSGSSSAERKDYGLTTPSEYVEYDPTEFYEMCDELKTLADGKDADAVIAKYDEIYAEYKVILENSSILYINYCQDPTDEYWSEQSIKDDTLSTECSDAAYSAIKAVCDGPCADAFKEYVGEDDFEAFAEYEEMTEEEKTISNRISELLDEYYTAIEEAETNGTSDEELNNIVGPIYLELVQLRTQLAGIYGYDNYADYRDKEVYDRDFGSEEAEKFHEAVKEISSDVYYLMYYTDAYVYPSYSSSSMNTGQCLDTLKKYAAQISPMTEDAADLLIEEKLYNIDSSSSRKSGAYTTILENSGVPYIFMTTDSGTDFTSLTHEFGHFTEFSQNSNPNVLLYGLGALDLCEIHSNGLEALYTYFYDDIFGNESQNMQAYVVIDLLSNIVEGCKMDEFQREIYANPDMTLDEINKLYQDLSEEYGQPTSSSDYWWMYVSHNFESPMYYLSYACSAYVALQIWVLTQVDFDSAVDLWESFVEAGAYEYTYMELMEKLGRSDFTDGLSLNLFCSQAISFVYNNCNHYFSYGY